MVRVVGTERLAHMPQEDPHAADKKGSQEGLKQGGIWPN